MLEKNVTVRKEKTEFTDFTLINTNARSLCPKINSLIDTMEELDAAVAIVTETWLAEGKTLEEDRQDLLLGAGISMICRNRKPDIRGMSYGGVAILSRDELCKFVQISVPNPDEYEVVLAAGSIQGHSEKLVVVACYIPPNYNTARGRGCLKYISDCVIEVKRRYKDPPLT